MSSFNRRNEKKPFTSFTYVIIYIKYINMLRSWLFVTKILKKKKKNSFIQNDQDSHLLNLLEKKQVKY